MAPEPRRNDASRVAGAAGIMMAAILASRVLGLVRDSVIAAYFGANWITDAYKQAFRLPDFLYYLIAGGALSSAFIPVFTEYLTKAQERREQGDAAGAKECEDDAWRVFSIFGTLIFCGLSAVVVVGELFTVQLLHLFVIPGWKGSALELTTNLTRIILPAQLCFFLGGLMMATLYARKHFLMPALGPVVYNIAIIVGGVVGGVVYHNNPVLGIYGLAVGVVVGAIAGNVVMQLWAMRRFGATYRPSFDYRHPGVVKMAKLLLPVLLGLSLPQLHINIAGWFASFLEVKGTITWLDNANKVMQMPLGIFGQALSVALLPTLSTLAAQRDFANLRTQFSLGLRSILFLTVPSSVLIIVLAHPLTQVLFQRGRWTPEDTRMTAVACILYSLSIWAVSGQQIVNRGFYALQDTVTPMVVGSGLTVLYAGLCWLLMQPPLAQNGLAIAFSICNTLAFLILLGIYHRRVGGIGLRQIGTSLFKVCLASLVMGGVAWAVSLAANFTLPIKPDGQLTNTSAFLLLVVATALSGGAYLLAVRFLRVPEAEFVFDTVLKRLRRRG